MGAEASEEWIGRVIGDRYRIDEALGEGAMGAVFVAEHLTLRKKVALKVVRHEHLENEELRARFAREAMATARLSHPHVVSAQDYGSLDDGSMYLVMELVSGQTLRARLEDGPPLSWVDAVDIAAQVADALIAAHDAGIVHRDLKPDNVMLQKRRGGVHVKVLDFGIARVPTEEETATDGAAPGKPLTRLGRVMGTPGYMAPEQAMGDSVDARADIYALGVILWEMITHRRLFGGAEFTEVITQQLTTTPDPVEGVPPELRELIATMLAVEPGSRVDRVDGIHDTFRRLVRRARRTPLANVVVSRESVAGEARSSAPLPFVLAGCAALGLLGFMTIVGVSVFWPDNEEEAVVVQSTPTPRPPPPRPTPRPQPPDEAPTLAPPAGELPTGQEAPPSGPASPWDAPAPDELARIRAQLDAGRTLSNRVDRTLTGFAARNPDDPRGFLLLARVYLSRRWRADAIGEYEKAFRRDPDARGDPQMLADLVALVPHRTAGDAAGALLEEAYGAEALPAVERALEAHRLDPAAAARYVMLRRSLGE